MAKQTLKHALPNGEVATRTTARAYTHVLLSKVDNAAAIAAYQAGKPERLAYALKSARADHADEVEHAKEWNAKRGGTLDGYLAYATAEFEANEANHVAYLAARSEEWQVVSWHSRASLAKPKYEGAGDSFRVEAINGGIRS